MEQVVGFFLTPTGAMSAALVVLLAVLAAITFLSGPAKTTSGSSLDDVIVNPVDVPGKESDPSKTPMMIFFGTETGNAQMFAKTAEGEAERYGFAAHVVDLEQFVPEMLTGDLSSCDAETRARVGPMVAEQGPIAMFFVATCGEGDPTNNAREFVSWLDGDSGDDGPRDLSRLRYAVFALGNTSYEHFNAAGKAVDAGLAALGAQRAVDVGLGDDNGELETQCEDWRIRAWPALSEAAGGASTAELGAAASAGGAGGASLPSKQLAPYKFVPLEPPHRAPPAPDTARDDLRHGIKAAASSSANSSTSSSSSAAAAAATAAAADLAEAAVGGAAPAVAPAGGSWSDAEPLRMLTRRQLMAQGADADPVRAHWFEAVPVRVSACRELRQKPVLGAATAHVELDVGSASVAYGTADNAAVLPENSAASVEAACKCLELDPAQWFTLDGEHIACALARSEALAPSSSNGQATGGRSTSYNNDDDEKEEATAAEGFHGRSLPPGQEPLPFPLPCTIGKALQRYCDLNGPVSKALVGQLAHWAQDESERAQMERLVSVEGRPEWDAWARRPQRSVLEVLQAFPSLSMPPEQLLHLLPPLKAREYTIASSALANPTSMHLAVSVINESKTAPEMSLEHPTNGDASASSSSSSSAAGERRLEGVCSTYLSQTAAGGIVRLSVRPSTFKLPADARVPIVMVGPGTGLAPMRAICQERQAQQEAGVELGEALLFFGCRRRDVDFIYRNELLAWEASGVLTELHTAFSREKEGSKVYVQHRLREQGARVWSLVQEEGAYVYVCGATAMGTEVTHTLAAIAAEHGKLSDAAASEYVRGLERSHRLIQELWS